MSIVAVERALVILRLMARSSQGVSVRGLGRELGYSPAIVQKILQALLAQDYAEQDPVTHVYRIGPAALQVGLAGLARLEVREVSRPYLESLAEATGETSLLAIRRADVAIYIDQVPGRHEVRLNVTLGDPRPFNCTAVGKALLAFMDDEEVDRLHDAGAFETPTENSIRDPDRLRTLLAESRANDLAIDEEEFVLGAQCVAAPVRNHENEVVAAIAVAGPVDRMRVAHEIIVSEVSETARRISAALGSQTERTASISA